MTSTHTLSPVIHTASMGDTTYQIRRLDETWSAVDSDEPAGRSSYLVDAITPSGFLGEVARFRVFGDARDWVDGKVGQPRDPVGEVS